MIRKIGSSPKLGKYLVLEDTYGNRYTYAELGKLVRDHRTVVDAAGKEQQIPVESQDLRPRLRALPDRAAGDAKPENEGAAERRRRPDRVNPAPADGSLRGRLEGDRRHRPGQGRRRRRRRRLRTSTSRSAPPAAAPRGSTRSRSSTAGSCSKRRRSTAPRARTRSSPSSAAPASCCSPRRRWRSASSTTKGSRSTRAAARTSKPARSTAGSWRCSSTCAPKASR